MASRGMMTPALQRMLDVLLALKPGERSYQRVPDAMVHAVLMPQLEERGYARLVNHRDHTQSYVATVVRCDGCLPAPDAVNHVSGHIFVGWGLGWQPCLKCHGAGIVDPENKAHP